MKTVVKILSALALAGLIFTGCSKTAKQKTPARDARLENIVWQLTELNGKEIAKADKYEITFGADGRVSGIGECNRFFGPYEVLNTGGGIKIGPAASTMMACLGENYEAEYFRMFEDIRMYQFTEDKLYMFAGGEMKARAIFIATPKTPGRAE